MDPDNSAGNSCIRLLAPPVMYLSIQEGKIFSKWMPQMNAPRWMQSRLQQKLFQRLVHTLRYRFRKKIYAWFL